MMEQAAVSIASHRIRGLYAVTPDERDTAVLAAKVRAALAGGATLVQYRNKAVDSATRREQAITLLQICRVREVPLIINDDLRLALDIDADGVHLGEDDGSLEAARARLATDKIVGASCYDRLPLARAAQRSGASYVAFGSFFSSNVKPAAVCAPLQLLRDAKASMAIPVVAIGGITAVNAPQLVAAGADCIAVISALFAAGDVEAAARQFVRVFSPAR
jgi:thiamine-phosphate pyrophosphorylase